MSGDVVMPEHVHLLLSEPERGTLSVAIQRLKQITSHELKKSAASTFWQARYYDFNVWSEHKRMEKLGYIHCNPVKRGLVKNPEEWELSALSARPSRSRCGRLAPPLLTNTHQHR